MKQKINEHEAIAHIEKIFNEEMLRALQEEVDAGRMSQEELDEKSTLGHLGSAIKGYGKQISKLFHNFAKTLDIMMNQGLIPDEVADKVEDKLGDVKDDLKQPGEQADAVGDMEDLMRYTAQAAEKAGSDKAADKVDDLADKAEKVEDEIEDATGGDSGGEQDEKIKAAVLDIIDATNEKWDKIAKATKDPNLKKAMDYMEKVALAEMLMKEIRRQIHEMNSQNKNKRLITKELRGE